MKKTVFTVKDHHALTWQFIILIKIMQPERSQTKHRGVGDFIKTQARPAFVHIPKR